MSSTSYSSSVICGQFKEHNDGLYVINHDTKTIYINFHTSNKKEKFVSQWNEMIELVNQNAGYDAYLSGDSNAVMRQTGMNSFKLMSKDAPETDEWYSHLFVDRVVVGSDYKSTTGKVRFMTSQIQKLLKVACESIDFIMYIGKCSESHVCEGKFIAKYNDYEVTDRVFAPVDWLSDHALINAVFSNGLKIASLNCFGESVSDFASNLYEMLPKDAYDEYLNNADLKSAIDSISNDFKNKVINYSGESLTVMQHVKKTKIFSKQLRSCGVAETHIPPVLDNSEYCCRLKEAYDKAHQTYQDELSTKSGADRDNFVTAYTELMEFYKQLYSQPLIADFLQKWYLSVRDAKKKSVVDILKEQTTGTIMFLQELSSSMVNSVKQYCDANGFEVYFSVTHGKTQGAIVFIK